MAALLISYLTLWNYLTTEWAIETNKTEIQKNYFDRVNDIDKESNKICNDLSPEQKLLFCERVLKQKVINDILQLEYEDQITDPAITQCKKKTVVVSVARPSLTYIHPKGEFTSVRGLDDEQYRTLQNVQKMYKCPTKNITDISFYENIYVAQSYDLNGVFLLHGNSDFVTLVAHIPNVLLESSKTTDSAEAKTFLQYFNSNKLVSPEINENIINTKNGENAGELKKQLESTP